MTDTQKVEALREYIMTGTEYEALAEIASISYGYTYDDPMKLIYELATNATRTMLAKGE